MNFYHGLREKKHTHCYPPMFVELFSDDISSKIETNNLTNRLIFAIIII